jgi:hypothetical protein
MKSVYDTATAASLYTMQSMLGLAVASSPPEETPVVASLARQYFDWCETSKKIAIGLGIVGTIGAAYLFYRMVRD